MSIIAKIKFKPMQKISKKNWCLYLILFCTTLVKAQSGTPLQEFEQARSQTDLLKNELQLIPVKDLANTHIAYLDWGGAQAEGQHYFDLLARYTRIDKVNLPKSGQEAWLAKLSQDYDLILVGLHQGSMLSPEWLTELAANPKCILSVFYNKEEVLDPKMLAAGKTLLSVPEIPWAASVASQIVFGALEAVGSGLTTTALNRLAYAPPVWAGMDAKLLSDSIRSIVEEGIAAQAFPGAQVLVAKNGTVIYHETFGYHTYENEREVKPGDLYDFASLTKVTSGLPVLMKLYGEGKFDLDARLEEYYPDFKGSNKGHLSFRSMLSHNARLMPWIPYWQGTLKGNARYPWRKRWDANRINDYRFRNKTFSRDSSETYPIKIAADLWQHKDYRKKMFKAIRKSPLNEKPGYVYSGLLFYLLPDIIANLVDTDDFETYIKDEIYRKIGAWTITYNPTRFYPLEQIIPTERDTFFSLQQIHGRVHDEGAAMMGGVSCNAGLFATTTDLAKLMQLYLNKGNFGGQQIIASEAVDTFITCHYCGEGNFRGIGFDKPLIKFDPAVSSISKDAGASSFGHSGYTGTFAWADPESGVLFIFMSNRVQPSRSNRKLYELGIRPRIHQAIYDAIE